LLVAQKRDWFLPGAWKVSYFFSGAIRVITITANRDDVHSFAPAMPQDLTTSRPITVFIHSYNRPLYLWASLDSLYRGTRHPHRFVFLDMASDDRLVRQVVAGFERRGMFSGVVWSPRGDADSFGALPWPRLARNDRGPPTHAA
jgi:hypothetical protein